MKSIVTRSIGLLAALIGGVLVYFAQAHLSTSSIGESLVREIMGDTKIESSDTLKLFLTAIGGLLCLVGIIAIAASLKWKSA